MKLFVIHWHAIRYELRLTWAASATSSQHGRGRAAWGRGDEADEGWKPPPPPFYPGLPQILFPLAPAVLVSTKRQSHRWVRFPAYHKGICEIAGWTGGCGEEDCGPLPPNRADKGLCMYSGPPICNQRMAFRVWRRLREEMRGVGNLDMREI